MKIDATKPYLSPDAQAAAESRQAREKANAGQVKTEDSPKGDVVRLSDRSRMTARAGELAAGAPDVRQERVNELKERINAGTYDVSGRTVAEAIIKKSITEV